MTRAAVRLGSSTTGLLSVVLAIVVVVIGLAGPAGALAQDRPSVTQANIGDGAIQPRATIYDSTRSGWSGTAEEASSCVYDSDVSTRADAAGVPSRLIRGFLATRSSREANFVQRQQGMLDADVGYNVSPESTFANYPSVGRSGTFVTDGRAVSDAIGHTGGSARYSTGLTGNASRGRISYFREWRAERALGLERGSLRGGFRVTEVQGITGMSPRSPLTGNPYFQGGGQGLPGGGPEVVVDPIPTSPWP